MLEELLESAGAWPHPALVSLPRCSTQRGPRFGDAQTLPTNHMGPSGKFLPPELPHEVDRVDVSH